MLGELGQIKITLEKGASAGSSIIGGPQCTETLAGPVHEKSKKVSVRQRPVREVYSRYLGNGRSDCQVCQLPVLYRLGPI